MVTELLAYQLTIIKASQHYDGLQWRAYDTHFRVAAAATGNRSWSKLRSLSYVSVDQIASCVLALGRGSLMAKCDVKHAYRQVPQDRPLLGMYWQGQYYVDTSLPFCLRSAPLIFSAVADALEWVVSQAGVENIFHYIDDYIIVGPPGSPQCETGLLALQQVTHNLGIVLAEDKTEGPATALTILGIDPHWRSGMGEDLACEMDWTLLSDNFSIASRVVRAGRCFMRRLYDLLASTHHFQKHFSVRLNAECQADVEWWVTFCKRWNGVSIIRQCQAPQAKPAYECAHAVAGWVWFLTRARYNTIVTIAVSASKAYRPHWIIPLHHNASFHDTITLFQSTKYIYDTVKAQFNANPPIRDNLRIRDSGTCTKVSLIKRFHCSCMGVIMARDSSVLTRFYCIVSQC